MRWGEIQIESLKKMFLNNNELKVSELSTYLDDKKYKTYLYAMPQACNEAINYICNQLPMNSKLYDLEKDEESDYYDLNDLIDNFSKLKDVISTDRLKWKMVSRNLLHITDWKDGTVQLLYETKPDYISSNTKSNVEIDLPYEYVNLIPLYIAGELYKDDDLTLATMYMNEFMTLIENYKNGNEIFSNSSIKTIYNM